MSESSGTPGGQHRSGFSILPAGCAIIAFMANRASVIFERNAIKIDQVWVVVATHPSGQQEHILGFHTEAEAMDWRVSQGCRAWLETRGYVGWKLGAPVRIKRSGRATPK